MGSPNSKNLLTKMAAMTSTFMGATMVKSVAKAARATRASAVVKADLYPEGLPNLPGSSTYDGDFSDGAVGPYANWQAHIANPVYENVWKYIGLGSTAGLI